MTPQFALRVAIMGGIALAAFSIIFLRLWYLEILSEDKFVERAQNNRIREIEIQAPRGQVVDRNGTVLVENRTALALQVQPSRLPSGRRERRDVLHRVGELTGISTDRIERELRRQTRELPASPATLRRDVPYELVYYLQERQEDFPGVSVERVYVRDYPQGALGAHLFGYVREVNADQLKQAPYKQLDPGDMVGQTGVEYSYDHLLRGEDGATRVQVDALGRPRGEPLSDRPPAPGDNLVLTIDAGIQEAGEAAISQFGLPGAFVAMDAKTGEIYGMGSTPSYDPSVYTKPRISQSLYESLNSEESGSPQTNRAIQGLYPTGSTFKLITATAALEEGLIEPDTPVYDDGSIKIADQVFNNAGETPYGTLTMRDALKVSSDVYFYDLGQKANSASGQPIQTWASRLGLGAPTEIDLPGEWGGLVPTPEWRNELYRKNLTDRPWTVGDNVNLSVGQGDVQVTPLQIATAYAAVANGGSVVTPHVGERVEDPAGRVVQEIEPEPQRTLDISPSTRTAILEGLRAAAMEPGGTSYGVFGGFPIQIAGKTGTAERPPNPDQSWYVAMAPYEDPEVVVAVTIERGGFGADTAAPAAAQILQHYFSIQPGKIKAPAEAGTVYE